MVVQPIDVCGTSGLSTCAPFNTTSTNGVGNPSLTGTNPPGSPLNPIGFTVNPLTGATNPATGGVDITRTLLNQIGVDWALQPMATFNSPINSNTGTTFQTLNVTETTNSEGVTVYDSTDFRALSYQTQAPPGISQGAVTTSPNTVPPFAPLGVPSTVINLFFVDTLVPPAQQSGGTLYGLSWIGNNGVSISQNTFGYPRSRTSLPPRPDTIAHELLHNLGLDHTTFAAGPYTQPSPTTSSYIAPLGVAPPIPENPLASECDPSYPACSANLMTTGSLRTEPTIGCALGANLPNNPCTKTVSGITVPLPTLLNGMADQVTPLPSTLYPQASTTQQPESQQTEVLSGGSGLLCSTPTCETFGFLNPIPHETTKAQIETRATGSVVFDLSGPTNGAPNETLAGWILTIPEEQTFAERNRFHVISQSRRDLVRDVNYYPHADNNPLMKEIGYYPAGDKLGATSTTCAGSDAQCLIVKFQPPGAGAQDFVRFSESILKGGAPITKDDLCKAKITYIFSDGYATTSDLGPCPATSLPLISSSWHPDPTVPPRIGKTGVILAQTVTDPPLPCTPLPGSNVCPSLTLADGNPREEGGQQGQSCDNGATSGTIDVSGIIRGNVTVSAGQQCRYTSPCEIRGNLNIHGGGVYLNCAVDGNLTMTSGSLTLAQSGHIFGNTQISSASIFSIGPNVEIDGTLSIQDLPANNPQQPLPAGTVCSTTVRGNLIAQNNDSLIQIGGGQTSCPVNTIGGNLLCQDNTPPISGSSSNIVSGQNQCHG